MVTLYNSLDFLQSIAINYRAPSQKRRLVTEKRGFRVKLIEHPRYQFIVYRIEDGQRVEQAYFHSERAANAHAYTENLRLKNEGLEGQILGPELRGQAIEATRRLAPYGKRLRDAVDFYELHLKSQASLRQIRLRLTKSMSCCEALSMSASFWYKLAQNLLSGKNSLVPRRMRNSLRFSPLYLYLGMKQALAIIEAEFPNLRFPKLKLEIDRGDGMYMRDHPAHYFYVAYSALACIQVVRTKQSRETLSSVLDLPCGHGRVLRALKAAFPEANFTACDLDEHGVGFCARTFGATSAYSNVDPRKIRIQAKFDLIWVGSLFTHLSGDRWSSFLDLFNSILAKDGLLFFSTHGDFVVERLERFPKFYGLSPEQIEMVKLQYAKGGFGYADYAENPGYGISLSAAEWVKGLLRLNLFDLTAFMPTAWDKHQDVWAVKRKILEPTLKPKCG